jgi:RNA polymerase sigma factor (sigma-70 family)
MAARVERRGQGDQHALTAPGPVEHFFRHEYGRLVATLSRRVGVQHIEAVEDAVQSALMTGLETWTAAGLPDNPSAWLFRVAHNHLRGELRQRTARRRILEQTATEDRGAPENGPEIFLAGEMPDDLLRMLFVCCDEAIPAESQLVFALKSLCGFDIREIALRLFTSEANVYKRLGRARSRLRKHPPPAADLSGEQYRSRLPAVNKILYLLFTEGYLSSHAEMAIRRELCDEAIRLAAVLAEHPVGQAAETFALLALMHLHAARMSARQDGSGGLLLLEEQNRELWDRQGIQVGLEWLARSAQGDRFSRYHAEAGIAAEHCLAPSFHATRWEKVAECYSLLERIAPSAIHRLNRAVAVAEWQGPAAGLDVLDGFEPPTWLAGSYLWAAVLADLHRRCGNAETAMRHRDVAFESAPTPAVKALLQRRLRIGGPG